MRMRCEIQIHGPSILDPSLLQCNLPLSLFVGETLDRPRWKEGHRLVGLKETDKSGLKGVLLVFIVPLIPDTSGSIPDTSGIRGLAQIIPKYVLTLPNPFSVVAQSKKVYDIDPNRVLSLFLIQCHQLIFFLFQIYGMINNLLA